MAKKKAAFWNRGLTQIEPHGMLLVAVFIPGLNSGFNYGDSAGL
jgi:hypothetical protein